MSEEFHGKSSDELAAMISAKKTSLQDAMQDELRPIVEARKRAVVNEHVQAAITAVEEAAAKEGRTPEEMARYWLTQDYADPGRHINALRYLTNEIVNADQVDGMRAAYAAEEFVRRPQG